MSATPTITEPQHAKVPASPTAAIADPLLILGSYERAVHQQQAAVAVDLLIKLVTWLKDANSREGLFIRDASERLRSRTYTRIAAAISAHVCAPNFALTLSQYNQLCASKWVLEAVFNLSGFGDAQHLFEYESRIDAEGKTAVKLFLALFFALDDVPDQLMQGVLALPGKHLMPLLLGWLSTSRVLTLRGEERLKALLDASPKLEGAELPVELLMPLAHSWMLCSYISTPSKHDVKRTLNAVWRHTCAIEGASAACPPRRHAQKPTLVVAAERMLPGHAMHRSYAHCLSQLRARFHVALLVRDVEYSATTAGLFDEVSTFPIASTLRQIAAKMIRLKPDLIYFPSLGMSDWTQAIANMRMAPIQFMTLGHPATSMTDTVDYAFIQACHEDAADSFSEKVIVRRGSGVHSPHSRLPDLPPRQASADGKLHIAVNSHHMKLSARFLAACVRLSERAGRPLHFHFFPSALGVRFDDLCRRLANMLPSVTVHEMADYPIFVATLSQCEMALSAFPFGNTNSAVDTCLLGIPMVAYQAPEVLSMGDRDVMRAVGLPEWLLADDDESYFQAALRLIQRDDERQQVAKQLAQTDIHDRLFKQPEEETPNEFVDGVWWMYENHEALQASTQHTFKVGEDIPA